MSETENNAPKPGCRRVPLWMLGVILLCALPGIGFPWMGELLTSGNLELRGLTWFYPVYIIASALLAWQCYGRRTYLSWIILALMLMSHAAFYWLAFSLGSAVSFR